MGQRKDSASVFFADRTAAAALERVERNGAIGKETERESGEKPPHSNGANQELIPYLMP